MHRLQRADVQHPQEQEKRPGAHGAEQVLPTMPAAPAAPGDQVAIAFDRGVAQLVEHWSPKPAVAGSSPVAPATHERSRHTPERSRKNEPTVLTGMRRYIVESWAELKKVAWPTRETVVRLTLLVVAVSVAVGSTSSCWTGSSTGCSTRCCHDPNETTEESSHSRRLTTGDDDSTPPAPTGPPLHPPLHHPASRRAEPLRADL